MAIGKITKRAVDALEPGKVLWDSELRGFGVRRQTATAVYILKYEVAGRDRWFTIGTHGSPYTPETARRRAMSVRGEVANGNDPVGDRAKEREEANTALTMEGLCELYIEAAEKGLVLTRFNRPKRASTLAIDHGRISRHIVPVLGKELVANIGPADIRRLRDAIAIGKTATDKRTSKRGRARVTGGAGTAGRVLDLMGGILTYAERQGIVDRNVVHGVERYRGAPRSRVVTADELARLGAALDAATAAGINASAIACVRLIALAGLRHSEATGLRWSEYDQAGCCLRLSATKTGSSMRAIGRLVIDLLDGLPRHAGSDFVFPASRGDGHYDGLKRVWHVITKLAGISDLTPQNLRSAFASTGADLGYSDATIGALVGHASRGVTQRHYITRPDAALIQGADQIARRIDAQMRGQDDTDAVVVPLVAAR